MPFEVNLTEMSGYFEDRCPQKKPMNKIMAVITIEDDEEEDVNNNLFSADDTDDIEILEIIPKLDAKTRVIPPQELKPIETTTDLMPKLTTDENCRQTPNDSSDILKTITDMKEDMNVVQRDDITSEAVVDSSDNLQNCPKSPKRIKPITLQTFASTSKAEIQSADSSSDPTPNKVRRMSSDDDKQVSNSGSTDANIPSTSNTESFIEPTPSTISAEPTPSTSSAEPTPSTSSTEPTASTSSTKVDFETLFQNYFTTFNDRMTALNANKPQTEELSKQLDDIHQKLKNKNLPFLNSPQFLKLMQVFTKEVSEMGSEADVVRHHEDLTRELFRFSLKPENKSSTKVKNKTNKIKALTDTIRRLQREIYAAESEELDFDAMARPSAFTDLNKLYRKIEEVWTKREELKKRSTSTGRLQFKRLKYDSTTYPEINKCVEKLFNNHMKKIKRSTKGYADESFFFIDVRKAILDVIREKQLAVMNTESMIQTIYKDLMNEKRARRQKDSEEVFQTLESLVDLKPETFVAEDPEITLKLTKNKMFFEQKLDDLFEKFTTEDHKKNGESMLKEGVSEWDLTADLVNNNEEFESLDVKDGDLEHEDNDNEEESDDEIDISTAPIPDFSNAENGNLAQIVTETEPMANGDGDHSSDEVVILS